MLQDSRVCWSRSRVAGLTGPGPVRWGMGQVQAVPNGLVRSSAPSAPSWAAPAAPSRPRHGSASVSGSGSAAWPVPGSASRLASGPCPGRRPGPCPGPGRARARAGARARSASRPARVPACARSASWPVPGPGVRPGPCPGPCPGRCPGPARARARAGVRARARAGVPGRVWGCVVAAGVAGVLQVQAGELVQERPVDVPGHHRGQRRVTGGGCGVGAGHIHRSGQAGGGGAGGAPARLQPGAAGLAAQLGQVHVHGQLRWLAVGAGQHPGLDQPPAGFGQRIMLALGQGAGIFGPAPGPQRRQHRGDRGGRRAGQVPRKPPGPADRGLQPHRPVTEGVLVPVRGGAGPLDHLLRQRPQIRQPRPAAGRGQQDRVRVRAALFGQLIGPLAEPSPTSCSAARPRARRRSADGRPAAGPISPPHRRRRC